MQTPELIRVCLSWLKINDLSINNCKLSLLFFCLLFMSFLDVFLKQKLLHVCSNKIIKTPPGKRKTIVPVNFKSCSQSFSLSFFKLISVLILRRVFVFRQQLYSLPKRPFYGKQAPPLLEWKKGSLKIYTVKAAVVPTIELWISPRTQTHFSHVGIDFLWQIGYVYIFRGVNYVDIFSQLEVMLVFWFQENRELFRKFMSIQFINNRNYQRLFS